MIEKGNNMRERVKKSVVLLLIGIVVNIALAVTKLYVGLSSNSITIMLDATNSFFDIITCFITLMAFIALLIPRGEKAPFGYGRSEYLAGFVVAAVSCVVGGLFFIRSLNRMAMPEPVWFGWQNCVLISVAVPVKLGIGLFYYFANKKLKSKALSAIMLDSFLDTAITATSLVSFAISSQVDYAVDAIFGMVMSIVIIAFAIKMIFDNVRSVVVGDGAKEERQAIREACKREGFEIKDEIIHDYGYGAKCGKITVASVRDLQKEEKQAIINRMREDIKAQTGADMEICIQDNEEQK